MHRLRLLTFATLGVLASCAPPDAGLRVTVTVRSSATAKVVADCLKLTVLDGTSNAELKSLVIARPADDTAVFGVKRGSDLPQTVKFRVDGLIGTCADEATLKLNAQSDLVTGVFPESGVALVAIDVTVPNRTLDADNDGFIAASKGGPDCRDDVATIFPGAVQICTNTADTDCNGQSGCDDGACTTAVACIDPPDRVALTAPATTMLRYECLGPIVVELRNANGPRTAVRDTTVDFTTSLAGTSVHGTANCSDTALTALPLPYGSGSLEVYLKADERAFGTTTLTATASRVATPGTVMVDVRPQPVDHVEFTSAPLTAAAALTAGECGASPVTLEFRDAMNRRTDVDSPTTVQLTSTPGDLANANIFFTDGTCATDGAMPMLQPGQGTVSLHLKARRAGSFTLRATPSTGAAASQALEVKASTPTQLAFVNAPLAMKTTDLCSLGTIQGQLQDAFQNPSTLPADLTVRPSVTGLTGITFFAAADTTCGVGMSDFTIAAGSSSVALRAKPSPSSTGMGTVTLSALNNAAIADASQSLFISAGDATKYTWSGSAQSPVAGVCSANPLTLTLTDNVGTIASATANVTFALSTLPAADASFRYFSNPGCVTDLNGSVTIPAGQTSATVYFRGNKVMGPFELRAAHGTLSGPTMAATGNTIRPAAPAKLVFTMPTAQTTTAAACTSAPFTANVLDQFDNLTSFTTAQTVTVSSTAPGATPVTVGQGGACAGSSVTLNAGDSVVSFNATSVRTTAPGTPWVVTATVNGFSTVPGANLTVTPGAGILQVEMPVGSTSSLTAGGCQQITLNRKDAQGNNAPTAGNTPLNLSFNPAGTWVVYASNNCSGAPTGALAMNSVSTVTFSVSPRTAGTQTLTASIGAGPSNTVDIGFTVAPSTPTLVFTTPNTDAGVATATQTAGGCTPVTVTRRDPYANDVPLGAAGSLSFTLPANTTVHSANTCLPGNQLSLPVALAPTDVGASFFVRAQTAGTQSVIATVPPHSATLTLTVNPGAAILGVASPAGGTAAVTANTCVPVTVERRDSFGNLVPVVGTGAMNNLTFSVPTNAEVFSTNNCTGGTVTSMSFDAPASTRQFSMRSNRVGSYALTATQLGQTVNLSLTVSPNVLNKLVVEGLPANVTAGACVGPLVVRRRDFWDNDITADPSLAVALTSSRFQFSSTPGTCLGATATGNVTILNGAAASADVLYAVATQSGATSVLATSTAPAATGSANSSVGPDTADHLFFLTTPGSVVAGACSAQTRVELRDRFENQVAPATPYPLVLSSTTGASFFPSASCTGTLPLQLTSAAPVGTFSFRPLTVTNSEVVSVGGSNPNLLNTQTWTVTPGAAAKLVWKSDPSTPVARFACASAGILQTLDANNNIAPTSGAVTVTPVASGTGGITFFSDAACTLPVTTVTVPSGASETPGFYFQATGAGPASLTATAPSFTTAPAKVVNLNANAGSLVVTPASATLEAGGCLALTIERRDDTNAALTTGTTTVNASVATPAATTLYTSSDCSTTPVAGPVTIAHGASTVTLYARGRSAANTGATAFSNVFTAADANGGSTSSTSTLSVLPLVRRGSCDLTDTNSSVTCLLSASAPAIPGDDLSRSFLVFTSKGSPGTSGNNLAAADQDVECHLAVTTSAAVTCTRAGTNGTIAIKYQVVSFGRPAASGGVSVQHFTVPTAAMATTTTTTITAVDTARSFILTSNTRDGAVNDGDAFPIVRFASTGAAVTSVEIITNTSTATRAVSFDVVTFGSSNLTVAHGSANTPAQTNGLVQVGVGAPPASTTSFALAMARVATDSVDVNYICKRGFNVKLSGNNVTAKRGGTGNPNANCTTDAVATLTAQRVSMTAAIGTVQAVADVTLTNTTNSPGAAPSFGTAVSTHRAIVFLGGQGPGGQTGGESTAGAMQGDGDDTGHQHALLDFASSTTLSLQREAVSNSTAVFSPYVVEFTP
jgi:hypothetical protein